MRPISLFIEKGSKGMTVLRAPEPPNVACRIVIWTSAEVPFVRTLGLRLVTAPEARSSVAFNLDIAAGTSRE